MTSTEQLSDTDIQAMTDVAADICAITAQYGPIPGGPVAGARTSFEQAWTNQYAPLAQWIIEHRSVPTHVRREELLALLGTGADAFGRFRGIDVIDTATLPQEEREDDYYRLIRDHGEGIYVEVHTRLGGGNRECWCEDETDHHCYVATIAAIQAMPGYVDDYDSYGDRTYADFFFRVEGMQALAQRQAMSYLWLERQRVLTGTSAPWGVFDVTHRVDERVLDQERDNRDGAYRMLTRLGNERSDILAAMAFPAPAAPPAPRQVPRRGRAGKPLKTTQPFIPTCTFAEAQEQVEKLQAKVADFEAKKAQLDAFMADPAYDLIHELVADRLGVALSFAESDRKYLADAITDRDVLVHRAHVRGTRLIDAEIARQEAIVARADAVLDYRAREWTERWPGPLDTCPPRPQEMENR